MKNNNINVKTIFEKRNKELKPSWIKKKFIYDNSKNIDFTKSVLRKKKLYSVCEEASCPNIIDCFSRKVSTFMILGNICTRKCPFCDVKNGRPKLVDNKEPSNLLEAVIKMNLKYVVITSVNRDDLHDGGAYHFSRCIKSIKSYNKSIFVEILVPDFRNCIEKAIKILGYELPNVFNHNIENVPRLHKKIKPGSNYYKSLYLLSRFKEKYNNIPTKSGIILGLGETNEEVFKVFKDLYNNNVDMLTVGQYLRPNSKNIKVDRYVSIDEFNYIKEKAYEIGFKYVSCGPFVRSSYNADIHIKNWIKDNKIKF